MADLIMTIPYDPCGNIGREYNKIMKACSEDWIGFMDYDIFIAQPQWYKMFVDAISVIGENAGYVGCMTNNIGCPLQRDKESIKSHDVSYHIKRAQQLYTEHNNNVQDVSNSQFSPSALMFVTSKKAWYDVGGFKEDGLRGVDTDYVRKLKEKQYKIYLLKGLYVYHWYRSIL